MSSFIAKNRYYILAAIGLLAAFLIFFRLGRFDLRTDDVLYSLRSIGYIDFLDSNLQTSPFTWFEKNPWWSRLSFHDAPPLVFLIQFIFFKILGVSLISARLPFAFAGLGSIILVYFIGRRLYHEKIGLLAAFLLTIFTYQTWASRVGYLEPMALFFALFTFLFFLKGLENDKFFLWFGVFAGLALLSKYTAIFVLIAALAYLFFENKKLLFNKNLIIGLILTIFIFSPVIIYNLMMFSARGHFDLQFSILFGQDISQDWPIISREVKGFSFNNIVNLGQSFLGLYSLPVLFLIVISIIAASFRILPGLKTEKSYLLPLVIAVLLIEFSVLGASERLLSLLNPFFALVLAASLYAFGHYLWQKNYQMIFSCLVGIFVLIFIFEIFYNLNTNHFYQAIGQGGKHYANNLRFDNGVFKELGNYLIRETDILQKPNLKIKNIEDLRLNLSEDAAGSDVIIYDRNLHWFSSLWSLRRYGIYYRSIVIGDTDLAILMPKIDFRDFFQQAGAKHLYYIYGTSDFEVDKVAAQPNRQFSARIADLFASSSGSEVKAIKDQQGKVAFKIYKLTLNN
ncbi:MAG: hypothetical protein A2729_03970 [Candidatus Buchananbacteria bacterium RIFCSPHIGHO2_01_FULL_39_14]|uniref:Glycosyltransferase RgtA/B/C/D-like domain-containing protein n=2 Tax=Candidatus Buchananiibacteriota TaxID=1817903 RepID=A0A1G1YWT1_9BACT|nr:MAG: hypothetical protein A2729_03970 [Candidatus Buchananbacteria bacterium RIFCSPHIGHO2_01_FULL_39_14]OGY48625.1 MAG: hypothetical protein A3D39_05165 [Candidatus Buchananbacteria bacterium RIFCSPHIGHO2_02_FULL_39_17]OGY56050.1 MAG: hypothetical protein A2912_03545 [Candidatus Buchananbacteria bacterium RIFCSPLOWO2_01_FULL_40_23b]